MINETWKKTPHIWKQQRRSSFILCVTGQWSHLNGKKAAGPRQTFKQLLLLDTGRQPIKAAHFPSRAQLPCWIFHPPWVSMGDYFWAPCHHHGFKRQWGVSPPPTPCVECWSFLTTAARCPDRSPSNVPNEYRAGGSRGGETCRGKGREADTPRAAGARHRAAAGPPDNPGREALSSPCGSHSTEGGWRRDQKTRSSSHRPCDPG